MTTNKKIFVTESMSQPGRALLHARDDIELVEFPNMISQKDFEAKLKEHAPVHGVALGGTRSAKRCLAMEMNVLVFDPYKPAADIKAAGCEPVADLNAALPRADFVSIHCPKNADTVGMFDADRLKRMKSSAYLINTARGGIVDEAALHAALISGKLAGAGLDVFAQEPPPAGQALLALPNVIMAPHVAGVTVEAVDRMSEQTARNILSVLDGDPLRLNVINQDVLG